MVIHGASSQKFNSLKRQIKFLDATCCASRAYQSLNSSKSLATLVSITLPIHFILLDYQLPMLRFQGEPNRVSHMNGHRVFQLP